MKPFKAYALTYMPTLEVHGEYEVEIIHCFNQEHTISKFFELLGQYMPNFITGFNDARFDWNFMVTKSILSGQFETNYTIMTRAISELFPGYRHKPLTKDVLETLNGQLEFAESPAARGKPRTMFSGTDLWTIRQIKVEANTNIYNYYLEIFGMIPVDTKTFFQRDTGNKERSYSLKATLHKCNQPPKADMPIGRLRKIYINVSTNILKKIGLRYNEFYAALCTAPSTDHIRIYAEYSGNTIEDTMKFLEGTDLVLDYCRQDATSCINIWKERMCIPKATALARLNMIPIIREMRQAASSKILTVVAANAKYMCEEIDFSFKEKAEKKEK
jgi:DNA polymerase elongation subunit (family B)